MINSCSELILHTIQYKYSLLHFRYHTLVNIQRFCGILSVSTVCTSIIKKMNKKGYFFVKTKDNTDSISSVIKILANQPSVVLINKRRYSLTVLDIVIVLKRSLLTNHLDIAKSSFSKKSRKILLRYSRSRQHSREASYVI